MDVSILSNATAAQNAGISTNRNAAALRSASGAYASAVQQADSAGSSIGNAYAVDISDEAKQAAAAAAKQTTAETDTDNSTKTKGLSAEQVNVLKAEQEMNQQSMINLMIQALTESNNKLQGWVDNGVGILNFGGVKVDASRFALPPVATTPEEAAEAVADGGQWSVGAVSDRIFGLAETLAAGNPEKLEEMRAAVQEGFRQAGAIWSNSTGSNQMPDITQQTYNELMHRFDTAMSKIAAGNA